LIEANELLGSFDARLREYAARKLVKEGVHLVKGIVKQVRPGEIELTSGAVVPFGLCVWSTGVGPTPFTLSLPFAKTSKGRLAIDERLRVLAAPPSSSSSSSGSETEKGQEQQQQQEQSLDACPNPTSMQDVSITQDEENAALPSAVETPIENVFALGDCCANADTPLPALAQVAEQQGKYLAQVLNQRANELEHEWAKVHPFEYKSLGSMATVGTSSVLLKSINFFLLQKRNCDLESPCVCFVVPSSSFHQSKSLALFRRAFCCAGAQSPRRWQALVDWIRQLDCLAQRVSNTAGNFQGQNVCGD
jgi:NADH:ubiquinone reductase (non-electrogenic)